MLVNIITNGKKQRKITRINNSIKSGYRNVTAFYICIKINVYKNSIKNIDK